MKYLIVGLGNIGGEYELTRHNIGFLVLDQLADKQKVKFSMDRHAYKAEYTSKGKQIHLIKPTTYMNLSGKAVNYWLKDLKIEPENMLVILDDIALPFGKLRMRPKGSSAGHNGLKDIEAVLGNQDYPRLRFGIGDNYPKGRQAEYVLSGFDKKEFEELASYMEKACAMVESFCFIGAEKTMGMFNS